MKNPKLNSRAALMALSLTILIGAVLAAPSAAEAGVKFRVRLDTPTVKASLHSGGHGPGLRVRLEPARRAAVITRFDRKVARKLARRTVYHRHELLRLKRSGYSWARIGHILDLPRRSVQNVLRQTGREMARLEMRHQRGDRPRDRDHRHEHRGRDSRRGDDWCATGR